MKNSGPAYNSESIWSDVKLRLDLHPLRISFSFSIRMTALSGAAIWLLIVGITTLCNADHIRKLEGIPECLSTLEIEVIDSWIAANNLSQVGLPRIFLFPNESPMKQGQSRFEYMLLWLSHKPWLGRIYEENMAVMWTKMNGLNTYGDPIGTSYGDKTYPSDSSGQRISVLDSIEKNYPKRPWRPVGSVCPESIPAVNPPVNVKQKKPLKESKVEPLKASRVANQQQQQEPLKESIVGRTQSSFSIESAEPPEEDMIKTLVKTETKKPKVPVKDNEICIFRYKNYTGKRRCFKTETVGKVCNDSLTECLGMSAVRSIYFGKKVHSVTLYLTSDSNSPTLTFTESQLKLDKDVKRFHRVHVK